MRANHKPPFPSVLSPSSGFSPQNLLLPHLYTPRFILGIKLTDTKVSLVESISTALNYLCIVFYAMIYFVAYSLECLRQVEANTSDGVGQTLSYTLSNFGCCQPSSVHFFALTTMEIHKIALELIFHVLGFLLTARQLLMLPNDITVISKLAIAIRITRHAYTLFEKRSCL